MPPPRCSIRMSLSRKSSIGFPGTPETTELIDDAVFEQTTLRIATRRMVPTPVPSGPRIRAPKRKKNGGLNRSRMVMFVMLTSSSSAPSTDSSANPWQPSNTQFAIVMFLKPPLDSVPNLMRPVRGTFDSVPKCLKLPSSTLPSSKSPLTTQFAIVTLSVARAWPSAYELFRQIPSSQGEFTVQFET